MKIYGGTLIDLYSVVITDEDVPIGRAPFIERTAYVGFQEKDASGGGNGNGIVFRIQQEDVSKIAEAAVRALAKRGESQKIMALFLEWIECR